MKAIIPVAGVGTNLRPLTYTQPKALIPIAGKTILSVIIDQLLEAGIKEFVFVIGYLGDKISDYLKEHYPNLAYQLVHQHERKGTAHAIWLTKAVVPDREVLIVFGDTIASYNLKEIIQEPISQIGVKKVDDPRTFGVAELDSQDMVTAFIEKPKFPKSNMALVGIYFIKNAPIMYQVLDEMMENKRIEGELNLTDALDAMIQKGEHFQSFKVYHWFDCGKKENVLETNAILLDLMKTNQIDSSTTITNSVILPPVSIEKNCVIENAVIGPNVTIAENTTIRSSLISDTIIGSFTLLEDIFLKDSIIGSDAFIRGKHQRLNIGDNTELDLS